MFLQVLFYKIISICLLLTVFGLCIFLVGSLLSPPMSGVRVRLLGQTLAGGKSPDDGVPRLGGKLLWADWTRDLFPVEAASWRLNRRISQHSYKISHKRNTDSLSGDFTNSFSFEIKKKNTVIPKNKHFKRFIGVLVALLTGPTLSIPTKHEPRF